MKKYLITTLLFFLLFGMTKVSVHAKEYTENEISYTVHDKEATVTGAEQAGEELEIPASLGGFKVTAINSFAFRYSSYVKVTMPDSIKEIGSGAFADNEKLKSIRLPSELKYLNSRAFAGCSNLAEIQFNGKLMEIGIGAFSECISLKQLVLPKSLVEIDKNAFEKCYKLSSIKWGKKVKRVGEKAFYKNYSLKSVQIPSGMTRVGDEAFKKCEDLGKVTFAGENTKLGKGVFSQCTSLKKVVLPKKLKRIPEYLFYGCKSLKSITLPKTATILKKRAFAGCTGLQSVKMSSKTYAIGDGTFAYSGLKKLSLSSNMQFIGNGAFQGTAIKSMSLKSKVTFIGNKVFADCKKLRTISIPASVRGINPGAFNNCTSLRAIHVASGNQNYSSQDGVLYNKNKTRLIQYPLHKMNKSFRTPASLDVIRSNAFSGNPYLQNVVVKAKTIGDYAFYGLTSLKSATILSGTTKIGVDCFSGCNSLARVTLPDSVSVIGSRAFEDTGLKRIHIPSALKTLERDVFSNCNALQAFEGGNGAKYKVQDGILYNADQSVLIKYPPKKDTKQFVVPESVKRVKSGAFQNASKLTKLEFGSKLTALGYRSISGAKNLKSIVINSKKLSSGYSGAINNCSRLAVIVGPNTYAMRWLAETANATLITL